MSFGIRLDKRDRRYLYGLMSVLTAIVGVIVSARAKIFNRQNEKFSTGVDMMIAAWMQVNWLRAHSPALLAFEFLIAISTAVLLYLAIRPWTKDVKTAPTPFFKKHPSDGGFLS